MLFLVGIVTPGFAEVLDFQAFWLNDEKYIVLLIDDKKDFPYVCGQSDMTVCWIKDTYDGIDVNYIFILEDAQEQSERHSV